MPAQAFTSRQVTGITGLTPRQIGYWRKTGLLSPSQTSPGGHARYSFTDLIALKAAKHLVDAGVSVQRMRKCITALIQFLPTSDSPLAELSLVVTGDVVLAFHDNRAFDALSGQEWVLPIAELVREVEHWTNNAPEQGELFPESEQTQLHHIGH